MVCIGGNGTFKGAEALNSLGLPTIGVPATIDNDLAYTDFTIGFDTALNTAVEAVNRIRDTGDAHERASIVTVMGRDCGDLALYTALACGAEAAIIPEVKWSVEKLGDMVHRGVVSGKRSMILVFAEGASRSMVESLEELEAKYPKLHIFGERILSDQLAEIVEEVSGHETETLKCKIEHPLEQNEKLLTPEGYPRRVSVKFKSALDFLERLRSYALEFSRTGPEFKTLRLDNNVLCEKSEMERMYRVAFVQLKPAQRIERIKNVLESRLEKWEFTLLDSYRERLKNQYSGRELDIAARFNVSHRLQPLRQEIKTLAKVTVSELYARALSDAPDRLGEIAAENARNKVVWWEDAPGIMFLSLYLGFSNPERTIRHLVVDEAQDYSSVALAALGLYYPMAHVTLLGDPKQRTTPGMHKLDPETWNSCFMTPGAPMLKLTRCYRSTLNITRLCNAILPDGEQVAAFGREGENPEILPLTDENVLAAVKDCQDKGFKSVCVVTRTLKQADRLSRMIPHAHLLDGSDEDILSDPGDVAVAGYQLMKGLEFDAVVVAWPAARLTDGERRRLYTACSRALHQLTLCADETLIKELAIIS